MSMQKVFMWATVAVAALLLAYASQNGLFRQRQRVVIVGAGFAGLQAAAHLHESGCCHVIVIEAQDRLGGRVALAEGWNLEDMVGEDGSKDAPPTVDIGATFIHGNDPRNPLVQLARKYQLATQAVSYDLLRVYHLNGSEAEEKEVDRLKELYDTLRAHVMADRDSPLNDQILLTSNPHKKRRFPSLGYSKNAADISLEQAFAQAMLHKKIISRKHSSGGVFHSLFSTGSASGDEAPFTSNEEITIHMSESEHAIVSWHFFWEIVQEQIAELKDLSLFSYDASLAYPGPDAIFQDGTYSVIEALAADSLGFKATPDQTPLVAQRRNFLQQSKCVVKGCQALHRAINGNSFSECDTVITTSCPVRSVTAFKAIKNEEVTSTEAIAIDAGSGISFVTDRIIITAPLGVLKLAPGTTSDTTLSKQHQDHVKLKVSPPIPRRHREAVASLGCSGTLKLAIQFPTACWPNDTHFFGLTGKLLDPKNRFDRTLPFGSERAHIEVVNLHAARHSAKGVLIFELDLAHAERITSELPPERGTVHSWRPYVKVSPNNQHRAEQKIIDEVYLERIRSAFPKCRNIDPIAFAFNSYIHNPFIRCGFSYWPPGRSGDDNMALGDGAWSQRLFFAGEHTTGDEYGNMHGAIKEGVRAASEIIFQTKRSIWEDFLSVGAYLPKGSKTQLKRYIPSWCPLPCR